MRHERLNTAGLDLGGQTHELTIGGAAKTILRLAELSESAGLPELLTVSIGCEVPPMALGWTGELHVHATVRWYAGRGRGDVTIDVPSGGTSIAVPGSDGIEVQVWATGTATIRPIVSATLGFSRSSNARPAQRTTYLTMPGQSGVVQIVPGWCHGLRCFASTPAALVAGSLQLFSNPDLGPAALLVAVAPAQGAFYQLPRGAVCFTLTCAAASVWQVIGEVQL
jgi:hypothetical protein